jgi:Flp pilus assembly protein TadG
MAFTAPVLVILVFGAVDVGQFVNAVQCTATASRVAARMTSRSSTTSASAVQSAVDEFLSANGVPKNCAQVSFFDKNYKLVTGDSLSWLASGEEFSVRVDVPYSMIRRISFLNMLNSSTSSHVATMRRE